jgi:hypothetical protein
MQSAPNSPWLDRDEFEVVQAFHGHVRPAKDLDLLVECSTEDLGQAAVGRPDPIYKGS